jgi:excisionase family DNA binding protein
MRLLTAKEVSVAWQIPLPRVYELARTGLIPCVRLGRQIRFDETTLRQWASRGGTVEKQQPHVSVGV